jgi:hypothetical protein
MRLKGGKLMNSRAIIFFTGLALLGSFPVSLNAEDAPSNAEILKLVKAGIPEAIILRKIAELRSKMPDGLDTSSDALIALKNAGASDAILNAILPTTSFSATGSITKPNIAAPVPPLQQAVSIPKPVKFKYNTVEFISIKQLNTEYRVTLKITNNGNLPHRFYGGRSTSYDPALGTCEQALLSDELGNAYTCKNLSIALLPKGSGGRGSLVAPGDSLAVVYSFARPEMGIAKPQFTLGRNFTFSAAPFADFPQTSVFVSKDVQQWANLDVQFDVQLTSVP